MMVLRGGLAVITIGVPVITLAPSFVVFAVGLAAYGVALGVVDAATNMQAVALEHRYGRPILPSFHGAWTFGGV
ncbi:MAG: MFS transporter, partial [Marmoricola sp.]